MLAASDPSSAINDLLDRLASKFTVGDACWLWTASLTKGGYGTVRADGRTQTAHRVLYELLVGPIPPGMDLDHECHNNDPLCLGGPTCPHRACVRPSHLTPATRRVNLQRGRGLPLQKQKSNARLTCGNGHLRSLHAYRSKTQWICRECHRIWRKR